MARSSASWRAQYNCAQSLLQQHGALLARLADMLMRDGEVSRPQLAQMFGLKAVGEPAVLAPHAERLAGFAGRYLPPPAEAATGHSTERAPAELDCAA
jgi:hypothetical protein